MSSENSEHKKVVCTHCGLDVPRGLQVDGAEHQFCCSGCRTVYALLHDQGMGDFYDLRESCGISRPQEQQPPEPLSVSQAESVEAAIVRDESGQCSLRLYVAGIHCAACVWLLERLPQFVDGVISARLHFAESRLDVVWDEGRVDGQAVVLGITRLGYTPSVWVDNEAWQRSRKERRTWVLRFAIAAACAMGTMHLGLNIFAGEYTQDLSSEGAAWFAWLSCLVCLPVIGYCAQPYFRAARAALRLRQLSLDVNIAVVIAVGFTASVFNMLRGSTDLYFDAIAMFVCFLLGGRLILLWAQDKTLRRTDAMERLLPSRARVVGEESAKETTLQVENCGRLVPINMVQVGDCLAVGHGEIIPCDGVLVSSQAEINAAVLSGESRTLHCTVGQELFAGCTNSGDPLIVRVGVLQGQSRMAVLLNQLREQQPSQDTMSLMIERVQAYFAPLVAVLALGTWLWWAQESQEAAWTQALAIILVCCPCALGLAAPLTWAITVMRLVRKKIFVRNPSVFERIHVLDHVVFDKTGTLTEGKMRVANWQWTEQNILAPDLCESLVLTIQQRSDHPIAQAMTHYCLERVRQLEDSCTNIQETIGQGMSAVYAAKTIRIGNSAWLDMTLPETEQICIGISYDSTLVAHVFIDDVVRPEAADLVQRFTNQGTQVHMCSGDRQQVCTHIATQIGIKDVQAEHSPEDKAAYIQQLTGTVLMVGDGLNDSLALKEADISISVRGGLEAALGSTHAYLAASPLADLASLLTTAVRVRATVRLCLWVSLLYNIIGVVCVAAGWWGPLICAVAMPLSSLSVIGLVLLRIPSQNK